MIDSYLSIVIGISAIILVLGLLFRYWGQPVIIAYIFAGILIGPSGFGIVTDQELMSVIGEVGVIMLLFFIGMEISLPKLLRNWRVAIVGTGATILLSIGIASLAGYALGWPFARSLLIGFVISISSTALLVKVLGEKNFSAHG